MKPKPLQQQTIDAQNALKRLKQAADKAGPPNPSVAEARKNLQRESRVSEEALRWRATK